MAYTTINKSTSYFNTKLYTGDGGTNNAQTGVGFRPDWIWFKRRSGSGNHFTADVVRGTYADGYKLLVPNDQDAEADYTYIKSLDSDGFTLGSNNNNVNGNAETYVAWNWLAGGSQGSSNTDGSINTTYTSVNTTSGLSICKWSGTGSAGTIGHGLGAVPKMIIAKRTSATRNWPVYHHNIGNDKKIYANDTQGESSSTNWNSTTPTSSVFSVGSADDINGSGSTYVAYVFAEKPGFSKFGKYTGNGNGNGSFVYTGFRPEFLLIKNYTSGTGDPSIIYDTKRVGYNPNNNVLEGANANAEASSDRIDILSNGFKLRYNWTPINKSGDTYIYMAFGQTLVGSNNVPATAR